LIVTDRIHIVSVSQSFIDNSLTRIFCSDYHLQTEEEEKSPDYDTVSVYSATSHVFVEDAVRMRLLSDESSVLLVRMKAKKCHLKSRTDFPAIKNERENIIFMDSFLYEHFEGIGATDGVPHFVVEYYAHSHEELQQPINTDTGTINATVYETTVTVTFLDDEMADTLKTFFRSYSQVSDDNRRIRFNLLFERPDVFRHYADFKSNQTRLRWRALAGVDD
jgi:hypothetical protein